MYIPSANMGEYDSWKPPPQKKMSSKQLLEAKYGGGGSLERQDSRGKMTSETINFLFFSFFLDVPNLMSQL